MAGYVDPKWGAAPAGGSYSLDPSKGWVPMHYTTSASQPDGSTTAPTGIINTAMSSGYNFVNNGGTDTLAGDKYMGQLQDGANSYNKATGQNLTAQQYDAMINPKDSQVRWNADGTQKAYSASDYERPDVVDRPSGGGGAGAGGAAGGATDGGAGSASDGTGIVGSARAGRRGAAGNAGYAPWNVTAAQTVEGRIASIMNPNNPIIAAARSDAVDQMNDRGLSNTSLATTAADRASYEAAIPIAQADAATYAKSAGYNSDIQNQMSMQGRALSSQQSIAQLQANTQLATAQLQANTSLATANISANTQRYGYDSSAEAQKFTAQLNTQSQQIIAGMDNANRAQIQQMQNSNSTLLQTNSNAASAFNQSMVAVANIEQNDKMDGGSKTQAIAQIMQNLQQQLTTLGKVSSIDLSGTLNFSNMPGFDAQGHWIGFPASTAGGSTSAGANNSGADSGYQGVVFQPSN